MLLKQEGEYHYASDPSQLQEVYNEIASGTQIATMIGNGTKQIRPFVDLSASAQVASTNKEPLIIVNWHDTNLVYTTNRYPQSGQVSVAILGPNNQPVSNMNLIYSGEGFAVFLVHNAAPGSYSAHARIGGQTAVTHINIGLFDPYLLTNLMTQPGQQMVMAGQQPIKMAMTAMAGDSIMPNTSVNVQMEHPLISPAEIMAMHQSSFDAMDRQVAAQGLPQMTANAKILSLQSGLGGKSLLPTAHQTIIPDRYAASDGDLHHFRMDTNVPGPHVARVTLTGLDENGHSYSLVRRVSYWVY